MLVLHNSKECGNHRHIGGDDLGRDTGKMAPGTPVSTGNPSSGQNGLTAHCSPLQEMKMTPSDDGVRRPLDGEPGSTAETERRIELFAIR